MNNSVKSLLGTLPLLLLLAACGGGGSGGGTGWQSAHQVAAQGSLPSVAPTPEGGFAAAWVATGASGYDIEVAVQDPEGAWSTPESIAGPGFNNHPKLAVDGTGAFAVAWVLPNDGIWFNVRPAGGSWAVPSKVVSTADDVSDMDFAVDAAGTAVLVWEQRLPTNQRVVCVRRGSAASGLLTSLGTFPSGSVTINARNPRLQMNAAGKFVLGWDEDDGAHIDTKVATYAPGSGWSATRTENDVFVSGSDFSGVDVAINANGDAVAIWTRDQGGVPVAVGALNTGGVWGSVAEIETEPGLGDLSPRAAIDGAGHPMAIWSRADSAHPGSYEVRTAALRNGAWETPVTLVGKADHAAYPAVLAFDGAGNALALLMEYSSSDATLWSARRPQDREWQEPTRIDTGGTIATMAMALAEEGRALVLWSTYDGPSRLLARLFE